jgi:predicted DNA-binding protein (UPF0251 family)
MKKDFTKKDFYDRLAPNGECLEWTRGCFNTGYGSTLAWGKNWFTHRLALELDGIDTTGYHVLHSCDNTLCCNPKHLRLGTHQDNMADMTTRDRQARGSTNGSAKLTEQDVLDIRAIRGMSQRAIAAQYGVSQTVIWKIRNRKIWQHI